MKNSIIALSIFLITFSVVPKAEAIYINGTQDAFITAGEAVDLNWDSQAVINRQGTNNYGTPRWFPGQPGYSGKISFSAGELTRPGVWTFSYYFTDDDNGNTPWSDHVLLTIYPRAPLSVVAPSCNTSAVATLSWNAAPDTTGGYVVINKPVGTVCPATWSGTTAGTSCNKYVSGSSVSFTTVSGTTYPSWTVNSQASSLQSLASVTGGGFTCTVAPQVNVNFI